MTKESLINRKILSKKHLHSSGSRLKCRSNLNLAMRQTRDRHTTEMAQTRRLGLIHCQRSTAHRLCQTPESKVSQ